MIQVRRTAEHDSFEVVVREGKARKVNGATGKSLRPIDMSGYRGGAHRFQRASSEP
jgi:hypothetical protein